MNQTFKLGDVYNFKWNAEELNKRFSPYHCFDGTLIVKERSTGLYLEDTYWSGGDSKTFSLVDAQKQGTLTFICNLNEVEATNKVNEIYYEEEDFITLFIHAGYQNKYYIKKGALKSQKRMLKAIEDKMLKQASEIEWNKRSLQELLRKFSEVDSGNLEIYI
jgi:metal-responsive CopG/Arc/MetJ family transcriptional regulator